MEGRTRLSQGPRRVRWDRFPEPPDAVPACRSQGVGGQREKLAGGSLG